MKSILALLVSALFLIGAAQAMEHEAQREFFEKKIRPVLAAQCYECHSAAAAAAGKLKGGLQLDSREGALAGGDSGPSVAPGEPAKSLLIKALKHEEFEMPPKQKLADAVIKDFEKWIADGAFDPRDGPRVTIRKQVDFEKARRFWSFSPVVKHSPPDVQNGTWPKNDLDRFVLKSLESAQLAPSADADDRVLVRRLYYDLIGLPPAPKETAVFLERASRDREAAIYSLVDELLASPHFGERWGRHWLDVARFAESNGRDQNIVWHHAWRYRKYVIDAFNKDLPYDRFVREHVAGDLLPYATREQRDAAMTATGMLAMSPKNIDEANRALFLMDLVDDQIDVATKAFLGLSVSCARCHDHKFDPIPTEDYYALAGIFASSDTLYGPARWGTKGTPHRHYSAIGANAETTGPPAREHVKELEQAHLNYTQARVDRYGIVRKVADLKNQAMKPGADAEKSAPEIVRLEAEILEWDEKIKGLRQALETMIDNPPPQPEWIMALRESPQPQNIRIHIRGETSNLGETAARGVLRIIEVPHLPSLEANESGRRQLAHWLASPHNPLTARVAVNRIWGHLFGRGIVATVDDFGATGSPPSHPELLDYLATRFVEDGWSTKSLVRLLVTSRTYRQSSDYSQLPDSRDADNRLLWRMNPKRLEVEPLRDAVLSVAGELQETPPSQPFLARWNPYKQHTWAAHDAFIKPEDMEFPHRTVYLPVIRDVLPEMFALFDFADPSRSAGQRGESIVPAQALFLMNSPWILERSRQAAQRVLELPELSDRARLVTLFERALTREPTMAESERLLDYLAKSTKADTEAVRLDAWSLVCQIVFSSAEFRTLR